MKTNKFEALWEKQDGRCAITRLPMNRDGTGLERVVMVQAGFRHARDRKQLVLALRWAADARGRYEDTDVRAVLSMHKAHRDDSFEFVQNQRVLMDHIGIILSRGGLSCRHSCANGYSVYHIEEPNEFDGRPEATLEYRGFVHFQSDVQYGRNRVDRDWYALDLADPNYHITLLRFFGVEEYQFQIFADHDVFADL